MKRLSILSLFFCVCLAMQAQLSRPQDICGQVLCEGVGVPQVVVTDGIDCVQTDSEGRYRLEAKRDVRFVYLSVPAGYLVPNKDATIPQFYLKIDENNPQKSYDFELKKNPLDDTKHTFVVQTDPQVTSENDVDRYGEFLNDMIDYVKPYRGKREMFSIEGGDMVGDSPHLFPYYIQTAAKLDLPIYRAIGNHDMTYGGRSFEYSYSKFEELFGPVYHSFNKGRVHYIIIDNCFYINRDYQYIGYIDERTFRWIESDLQFVPKDNLVIVVAHIPSTLTPKLTWNTLNTEETSNIRGLFDILQGRRAHFISGHTHYNLNVCISDSLMEHNTAAVCGIWWKASICMDGTPQGYGVYDVDGTDMKWLYKSAGYKDDYQMRVYAPGSSEEYPDDLIANVWNWDEKWRVEWYEDGKLMGEMARFTGYDPEARDICRDKERVVYDWISPIKTEHLFRATPRNPKAKLEVRATDRFGRVFKAKVGK